MEVVCLCGLSLDVDSCQLPAGGEGGINRWKAMCVCGERQGQRPRGRVSRRQIYATVNGCWPQIARWIPHRGVGTYAGWMQQRPANFTHKI